MNLFEIESELQGIFEEIEANEGELTDELLERLEVSKENLNDKLTSYCQYIKVLDNKINAIKEETKRLNTIKKQREKSIDFLKDNALKALLRFGDTDKKGITRIDLDLFKLSNRRTESVEINESRCEYLINKFAVIIADYCNQGVLYTGSDVDIQGILDVINAEYKAEIETEGGEYIPFTIDDLLVCNVDITYSGTIYRLLSSDNVLKDFGNPRIVTEIKSKPSVNIIKNYIGTNESTNCTIAKPIIKQSLTIK